MKDTSNPSADKPDLDASMLDKLVADKMELHCRQQLSAMLDGVLSPDEARFLLRRLQHDHELAACWERWQLCGDLMRGSAPAVLPSDFAQRVSAALTAESATPDLQATISGQGPRWARWAGGAALAASVAATALFVAQRNPGIDAADPGPVQQVSASSAAAPLIFANPEPAPAPVAPSQPDQGGTAALAATAIAAAELPRRAVRRNRAQAARAQAASDAQVETAPTGTQGDASVAVAVIDDVPARGAVEDVSTQPAGRDPFVGEVIAPARPWPRAVLPGAINDALNAGYGMGSGETAGSGFEYFEPQVPVEAPPQP